MISIIIPVYNQAEELRQCLDSVLRQLYQNYEVIIVNDGSTDNGAQVINEFSERFKIKGIRFKSIVQDNQGSNFARNRGFKECRGDYLIFWDADVVGKPEMLEKMHNALQKNPDFSYVYCSFIYGRKKFKLGPFDEDKLRQMPYIPTMALCRKEHFPGWDESIKRLQDWDVWLTMLEQGHKGVWVPEYLYKAMVKSGTISKWLPRCVYKIPWLKRAKEYREAVNIIKQKHQITNNKKQTNPKS